MIPPPRLFLLPSTHPHPHPHLRSPSLRLLALSHRQPLTTTTTAPASKPVPIPILSAGSNSTHLLPQLEPLLDSPQGGRWTLTASGKGVERWFLFAGFARVWEFMDAVAAECKVQNHHPEWTNVYNRTHIRWTTHKPPGLSLKDIQMARFCDEQAKVFGEIADLKRREGEDLDGRGKGSEGKGDESMR